MSQEALEKIKAMNVENIFSNISLWAHAKERDDSFFPSIAVLKSNFTHVQQRNRMQFHVFAALLFYAFSSALTILPTIILKCTVAYLAYQTRWYTNFLHHFSSGVIIGIRSNIYSNEYHMGTSIKMSKPIWQMKTNIVAMPLSERKCARACAYFSSIKFILISKMCIFIGWMEQNA